MRNVELHSAWWRTVRYCIASTLLLLFSSHYLLAQDKQPLDKRINFKVENVSLADALKKVRELSGAHLNFKSSDLKAYTNVSLHVSNTSVRDIIERLLAKTTLQIVESGDGSVTIMSKPDKKSPVPGDKIFEVNGVVTDARGRVLPHASIQLLTDKKGTTADDQGKFRITARENDVIRFSYLGMKNKDITVKQEGLLKVMLDSSDAAMAEYVVTGFQSIDKRMMTGAVTVLGPEKFLQPGSPSLDQMLQGKVPGMMTTFSSGSPSATPTLRIRGTSTIMGNASPLWVVDDVIREDRVDMSSSQLNAVLDAAKASNFSLVGGAISGINPYDIESMTFLKDAAATSLYGVRAANGVIVLKTKRGKAGRTTIGYNNSISMTDRLRYGQLNLMNSKERIQFSKEMMEAGVTYEVDPINVSYEQLIKQLKNREISQEEFDAKVGQLEEMNTDWYKILGRQALSQGHSLNISGGAGKSTFYASLSYTDAKGAFTGDDMSRITGQLSLQTAITNKLNLSVILSGNQKKSKGFYNVNPSSYALSTARTISKDSMYIKEWASQLNLPPEPIHYNILNELAETGSTNSSQELHLNATLNYKINSWLSFTGTYGASATSNSSFSFATEKSALISRTRGYNFNKYTKGNAQFNNSSFPFGGISYPNNSDMNSLDVRHQLNFQKRLFQQRDQITAMVSQQIRSIKRDGVGTVEPGYMPNRGNTYYSAFYNNYANTATGYGHAVNSENTLTNSVAWLGNLSYWYDQKYVISFNIRTDGSNRFGQFANQRFQPTWSISGKWDVHQEGWMDKLLWLDQFSLRFSYGTQGNVVEKVGPNLIAKYPTTPLDPISNEYVLELKSLPYPELRWEKTNSYNFGVDMAFLKGRISVGIDGYYKRAKDVLVTKSIPTEYGISEMLMNYGTVENKGADASVAIILIRSKNARLRQEFNFTLVKNNVSRVEPRVLTYTEFLQGRMILPGRPLGAFYSFKYAGLDPQTGLTMIDVMKDKSGFDKNDPSTWLVYSGTMTPTMEFGGNTNFSYKNFNLNLNYTVKLGASRRLPSVFPAIAKGRAPASDINLPRGLTNRWKKPGDEMYTNIPAYVNIPITGWALDDALKNKGLSPYDLYDLADFRVANASFLRCNSLSLSYSFSQTVIKTLRVQNLTLSGNISNPFIIANKAFEGQDPETSDVNGTALPITRSYNFSVNVQF